MYNREYEYVAAISKAGTLSGAATLLGVSQPALTHFLKKEEAELNTAIFQRIDNQMVLTYAGECYMENIEKILAIQNRMLTTIRDIAKMDQGRLRIGLPAIRRPFTIFSVIPKFKKKYPAIDLILSEQPSDVLEDMLKNLELDCIAVNVNRKKDAFEYIPIATEHYLLAVHKDSPLLQAARPSPGFQFPVISPRQLEGESFILLDKGHRIRQFADSVLDANKLSYNVSMHSRTLDGALEAVANNLGCTFTPQIMLSFIRGSKNIRYLSLDTPGTEYEFSLMYRKGAYLPPSTKDFLQMFEEAFHGEESINLYE